MNGSSVQGRKILLCVGGGIAAYKVAGLARSLAKSGADVRVLMTRSATRFVGTQTFASLTGNPVATEIFGPGPDVPHVELARGAELAIVAPATANLLAKMAAGLADDIVSATLLASSCPVLIAPAMHTEMWEHPATQANIELLEARGVALVGPVEGDLSSGDRGPGRMSEPEEILAAAQAMLERGRDLSGVNVLITAGGTTEPIDPVRFIGNRSSGRMGMTIAREAHARGAKVTVVAGAVKVPAPPGVEMIEVRTAEEMKTAVIDRAGAADVIIKAAAVADFKPSSSAPAKLKKAEGPPSVELVPTPDILWELGRDDSARKDGSILVGFAAETEPDSEALARLATLKLERKGADMIVANDVSSPDSGFEVPTNRAVIATRQGTRDVGLVTKEGLAAELIDEVIRLRS